MFPNLEAEMARGKITQSSIALSLGITPTTFSFKLNGKAPISLKECVKIKNTFFPDKTLDYLFATDSDNKECSDGNCYWNGSENIQGEEIVSREIYLSRTQKIVYSVEVSGE